MPICGSWKGHLTPMSDTFAVLFREYRLFTRDRVNLLLSVIPSAAYLLLFATSIANVIDQVIYEGRAVDYVDFAIPAIMLSSMIAGATTTATSIFQEELGGMTLELWSYPLRKSSYILGKLAATTALVLLQGVVTLLVAAIVFWEIWEIDNLAALIAATIATSLSLNAIYLYAATLFRDFQLFMIVVNVAAPVMLFASPSFYPLEEMPRVLQVISWINPVSYGVKALRDGLLDGFGANWWLILLMLSTAIVFGALASRSLLARFRDL